MRLREGGDNGQPLVLSDPQAPAATTLTEIAMRLGRRERGLLGKSLSLTPNRN
ncbi:MAG: sodium:proton antiporter, partial [Actinomycetes bacterium]